jgi:hypothetical protein
MTSQVNPNNIDGTYPVAGQDNDSQGFRDNFTNIRNNFTFVKAEMEDLQNKVLLKSALSNTTLNNDFAGNVISNPALSSWRENYNNVGVVSGAVTINFANGNYQKITLADASTLTFSFPTNTINQYAAIKLWVNVSNAAHTLTLPTTVTLGDPDSIAGLAGTSPPIITFGAAELANNNDFLFEFFTVDGGSTIGIRDLIRNRDVDLSGFSVTGNIGVDRITTTNGVFWANGSPFSVAGGSGSFTTIIASGNIVSAGNLVTTNGIFWAANGNPFVPVVSSINTTGNLVTTGNIVAGANLVTGNGIFWAANGNPFSPTINSIDATGNLVTSGNVVAGGNVVVGADFITRGGRINTDYAYVVLSNDQNFFANTVFQTIFFDTVSIATIANARIALPDTAEDGREIVLSFLAPITSLWINKGNTGLVRGLSSNSTISSGNVSVKFLYSAAASNWLRAS